MMEIDYADTATEVEIVNAWNEGDDPAFRTCWETRRRKRDDRRREEEKGLEEGLMGVTTVTYCGDNGHHPAEDNNPMDAIVRDDKKERIYIMCYHLPSILSKDPTTDRWNACWSESLIAKSELHGVSSTRDTTWIGTVSNILADLLGDPVEWEVIRIILSGMDCIPVFFVADDDDPDDDATARASDLLLDLMYLGFCKQVLWPSFHNVDLLDLATIG